LKFRLFFFLPQSESVARYIRPARTWELREKRTRDEVHERATMGGNFVIWKEQTKIKEQITEIGLLTDIYSRWIIA